MQSTKDFLSALATSMGKKPSDMEPYIKSLEDNWLDTVETLQTITDSQWSELKIPMGLVNLIKKNLPSQQQQQQQPVPAQKPVTSQQDEEMKIDTSSTMHKQPSTHQQMEANLKNETINNCLEALSRLHSEELVGNTAQHHDTVKTLFTIVSNLMNKPMDPQVRRLNKQNKFVQNKVLAFKNAVRFLMIIGFNFDSHPEQVELKEYNKEVFEASVDALNAHITSLGGQVANPNKFDPFKTGISSTTGNLTKLSSNKEGPIDVYDPAQVSSEIEKIKQERMKKLQSATVEDRDIKVFNSTSTGSNLKGYLMELDRIEAERLKSLKISEDKMDEAIESTAALKFLADVEKQQQFRNKRHQELEKMKKLHEVKPTALVRVKFPDEYVIQGTFGALEKVEALYQFIKEHLFNKEREFYLYEAPPKKPVSDMKATLQKARLAPSGLVYFAWSDLDQTRNTDGPFLDIASLKSKIIAF